MVKFIFDIDGTLTPSRQKMDKKFADWFEQFASHNDVYFVTGSDKVKTEEQVGTSLYNLAKRVYNCSGNDVWEQDSNVRTNEFVLPNDAEEMLQKELQDSKFPLRTGLHFEFRPGMLNFSIVGRNATLGERKLYVRYDEKIKEREKIADKFNKMFSQLEARAGGETGIDISEKGKDKSQIISDFSKEDLIIFFGDRLDEAGNDRPLADVNKQGINYHVKDWRDTWSKLNAYITNGS
jgi:phosphomannomutase